jgi:hypothetical protein
MSSPPHKRQKTGQLKREGLPRMLLPEEANKLNLWAEAYVSAGCRQPLPGPLLEEIRVIAEQLQANAPSADIQININVTHKHYHTYSSSPFSDLSTGDISCNVQVIETFNTPGLPTAAETSEQSGSESSDIVDIPSIGLRCSVAEIPAPPPLSYTTGNLRNLIHDWDSGTQLRIKGVYVPLKHWPKVYAKHRKDIYSKRKEIWRQWRVS